MTDPATQRFEQAGIAPPTPDGDGMPAVDDGAVTTALELTDPSLYINRELSWLDFNDRVLQLAEDESLPLMERLKFLAIFVTNLDEFFMIRVAGVHDQVDAGGAPDVVHLDPTQPRVAEPTRQRGLDLLERHRLPG